MIENPYQSPRSLPDPASAESNLRKHARRSIRISMLVLMIPAIYNYIVFDARAIAGRLPDDLVVVCRAINLFGFIIGTAAIWFLGLACLELASNAIRFAFARGISPSAWQENLHRSLGLTVYLAVPCAALWAIWVFGFYEMRVNFRVISWAVGIPAHLLAACLYLPLIYRWYRLAH